MGLPKIGGPVQEGQSTICSTQPPIPSLFPLSCLLSSLLSSLQELVYQDVVDPERRRGRSHSRSEHDEEPLPWGVVWYPRRDGGDVQDVHAVERYNKAQAQECVDPKRPASGQLRLDGDSPLLTRERVPWKGLGVDYQPDRDLLAAPDEPGGLYRTFSSGSQRRRLAGFSHPCLPVAGMTLLSHSIRGILHSVDDKADVSGSAYN